MKENATLKSGDVDTEDGGDDDEVEEEEDDDDDNHSNYDNCSCTGSDLKDHATNVHELDLRTIKTMLGTEMKSPKYRQPPTEF